MMKNFKQPAGFHWRDGWYFDRKPDGSVEVRLEPWDGVCHIRFTIPAPEWASIVCSVSKDGETYDRWMQSQAFHGIESDKPVETVQAVSPFSKHPTYFDQELYDAWLERLSKPYKEGEEE